MTRKTLLGAVALAALAASIAVARRGSGADPQRHGDRRHATHLG